MVATGVKSLSALTENGPSLGVTRASCFSSRWLFTAAILVSISVPLSMLLFFRPQLFGALPKPDAVFVVTRNAEQGAPRGFSMMHGPARIAVINTSQSLNAHTMHHVKVVQHTEHSVVQRQHAEDHSRKPRPLTSFHPGVAGLFHETPQEESEYLGNMAQFTDLNQFVGIENVCVASKLNPRWGIRQYDPNLNKYAFYRTSMMMSVQIQSRAVLRDVKIYLAAISVYERFRASARELAKQPNITSDSVTGLISQAMTHTMSLHRQETSADAPGWEKLSQSSTVSANIGRCAFVPRPMTSAAHPAVTAIQKAISALYSNSRSEERIGRAVGAALLVAELHEAPAGKEARNQYGRIFDLAAALRYKAGGEEKAGEVYADPSFSGLGACFLPELRPYLQFNLLWSMLFLVVYDSKVPLGAASEGTSRRLAASVADSNAARFNERLCQHMDNNDFVVRQMLESRGHWHFLKSKTRSHSCTEYGMLIDYWGNAQQLQTAHELRNLALTLFWEYAPPGDEQRSWREALPPLNMLMHHGANMHAIHNNPGMPARYASWLTRGLMSVSPAFVEASLHKPYNPNRSQPPSTTVACFDKVIMRFKNQWDMPLPSAAVMALVGKGILATNNNKSVKDGMFTYSDREAVSNLVKVLPMVSRSGKLYELLGKNTFAKLHKIIMRQIEIARHAGERNGPYTTNVSCTPQVVVLQRGEGSNLRAFANMPQVLDALKQWLGYTPPVKHIVGSMSLYEQAAAVAGADMIITPHGSHNMGTMFGGKTGVAMLEVMPHPRDTAAHGYSAVHGGAQYFSVGHTPKELAKPVTGAIPGRKGRPWSNAVQMRAASREWHETCRVSEMKAYWAAQEDIRGVSFPLWRFCQHRTKVRFITEADTIVDTDMLVRDARKVMAWMTGGRCK